MRVAEDAEEFLAVFLDHRGVGVGRIVQHIHGRIGHGGHQAGDFRIQQGVPAEAQVDDFAVQGAGNHAGMGHARTARAAPLQDAGAVHHDRALRAWRRSERLLQGGPFIDPDFEGIDPVIQRQVQHVLPPLRGHVLDQAVGARLLLRGPSDAGGTPDAVHEDVQVQPPDARRIHVRQPAPVGRCPPRMDGRGVGPEADVQACALGAEVPDGAAGNALEGGRKPLVAGFRRIGRLSVHGEGRCVREHLGGQVQRQEGGGEEGQDLFHSRGPA